MSWRTTKRRLALAIGVLALLGGGTAAAIAATSSPSQHSRHRQHGIVRHGVLGAASAYLGVSTQRLRNELHAGKSLGQIADATPGHSETGLVAALLAARQKRLSGRIAALVETNRPQHGHGQRHLVRQTVLSYLGLSAKQLKAKRHSGETLAQIADATSGRSSAGLEAAILKARQAKLPARIHSLLRAH